MTTTGGGMDGIVAAESAITRVDGQAGQLSYRGYPIGELAENCTFEEVAFLLWHGNLPDSTELAVLNAQLAAVRVERTDLVDLLQGVPLTAHPLDVLRYMVSVDAMSNPLAWRNDKEANDRKAIEFTAWFPAVVAGFHRLRAGLEPVEAEAEGNTAESFLTMLRGVAPSDVMARTFDMSLILHADHELNASTFAARVTIATQSNLHAAVASALGTLAGPRHGGASDRVIHMLEEIGEPERAEPWLRQELASKRRIMGFGHRVYKTADPRSKHLRGMAREILAGTPREKWLEILAELESVLASERKLYPNVDLYAAIVNYEFGIDPAFYTSVFAVSRIVGWTAHAIEQLDGRLVRPIARYTGPEPRSLAVASAR